MTEEPFHILFIGDLSGRFGARSSAPRLKPRFIDRDNFDDVMSHLNVSLDLQGTRIPFADLDNFHPDHLYQALGLWENLSEPPAHPTRQSPAPPADILGSILDEQGEIEMQAAPIRRRSSDLDRFVERITEGHVVAAKTPAQLKSEADRHSSAAARMRAILHDPRFQALESVWRSLYYLVRNIDTGADLKIYILDLTLPEFVANLELLKDSLSTFGAWSVLCGNYAFGQSPAEVKALHKIADLSRSLNAPFLAEALPSASSAPTEPWTALRQSHDAAWIGLALPRFLLRLPYGKHTSEIESFPFEEMPDSVHTDYLWGNPATLCVKLLAESFEQSGWDMNRIPRRVDGLPLHVYQDDGEPEATPCAEVLLTQSEVESLIESGYMPLASIRGQDAVLVPRFQSIAHPLSPLPRFR